MSEMVIYNEPTDWGHMRFIFILLILALKKEKNKKMPRLLFANRRLKINKKQF